MTPHLTSMALAPRATRPDAEGLVHGPRRFTWAELGDYVDRAAAVLQGPGVGPGEVVANQQGKAIEEVVVVLAAARLGATPLNLHPTLTAPQVADALQRSGARTLALHRARVRPLAPALRLEQLELLVTIGQHLPAHSPFVPATLRVQHLLDGVKATPPLQEPVPPSQPAALHVALGLPDMPLQTWSAAELAAEAEALASALSLGPQARLLSVIPFSTRPGLTSLLAAGLAGAVTHLQRFLEPADVAAACAGEGITHLWLTPEQLGRLMVAPAALAGLGPVTVGIHGRVPEALGAAVAAVAPAATLVAVPPLAPAGDARWVDGLQLDPAVVAAPFAAFDPAWRWVPGPVAGQGVALDVTPADPDDGLHAVQAAQPVDWPACLRPQAVTARP